MAEGDDRERRPAAERLEPVPCDDEVVEQLRLSHVVLDRVAKSLRAVRPEREPELERAERARVLERDVDHVLVRALVRDVRLLVRERVEEVLAAPDEEDAAGFREEEPLVGVERDRVGSIEAGEEVGRRGRRRRGQPVGAVDVEPDALLGAHVREPVDRVDGPGQRRTRGGDDGDGDAAGARSARIASATASGGRRRSRSIGSERTFSEPSPRISAARSIE